jgi:hypothetical protein
MVVVKKYCVLSRVFHRFCVVFMAGFSSLSTNSHHHHHHRHQIPQCVCVCPLFFIYLKRSGAAIIASATRPARVGRGRLAAVLRVAGHEAVLVQHDGVGGAAPEERVVLVLAVGGEAAVREGRVNLGLPCCDCRCCIFISLISFSRGTGCGEGLRLFSRL